MMANIQFSVPLCATVTAHSLPASLQVQLMTNSPYTLHSDQARTQIVEYNLRSVPCLVERQEENVEGIK
jgi:hypothetical protein